jgi:hypothetical protein
MPRPPADPADDLLARRKKPGAPDPRFPSPRWRDSATGRPLVSTRTFVWISRWIATSISPPTFPNQSRPQPLPSRSPWRMRRCSTRQQMRSRQRTGRRPTRKTRSSGSCGAYVAKGTPRPTFRHCEGDSNVGRRRLAGPIFLGQCERVRPGRGRSLPLRSPDLA